MVVALPEVSSVWLEEAAGAAKYSPLNPPFEKGDFVLDANNLPIRRGDSFMHRDCINKKSYICKIDTIKPMRPSGFRRPVPNNCNA